MSQRALVCLSVLAADLPPVPTTVQLADPPRRRRRLAPSAIVRRR